MFLLILICSLFLIPVQSLITCSKCDMAIECQTSHNTCKGDYCFHAQYFYGNEVLSSVQKGCVVGHLPTEGCRINHHGNMICFCGDSDYCNSNITTAAVDDIPPTVIPVQTCQPSKLNSSPKPRWVKPCAGNFCTFLGSKVDIGGSNYTYSTKDCNRENEFDFFPTFTVFNLYPGNCVWLQYGGQPNVHACYGTNDLDTLLVDTVDETIPQIECKVDYFSPRLPYIQSGSTCSGQYCFISATSRGDVYRGCVTPKAVEGATPLTIGYTRSYTGLEQWICDQAGCNSDLKSAEMSWPPELYLYRNISNLREFNVFYVSTTTLPSFFLTFLVAFGLL